MKESRLITKSIELRNYMTGTTFNLDQLRRIYLITPITDNIEKRTPPPEKKKVLKKKGTIL